MGGRGNRGPSMSTRLAWDPRNVALDQERRPVRPYIRCSFSPQRRSPPRRWSGPLRRTGAKSSRPSPASTFLPVRIAAARCCATAWTHHDADRKSDYYQDRFERESPPRTGIDLFVIGPAFDVEPGGAFQQNENRDPP